jgi:hypothetical protein
MEVGLFAGFMIPNYTNLMVENTPSNQVPDYLE